MKGSEHKSKFLLTNREREVFELLVQDKTTKDIAQQLFISEKTVRNHISNVMCFEMHDVKRADAPAIYPQLTYLIWQPCTDRGTNLSGFCYNKSNRF
ncbi:helix-turn-helix domain-containing protein [Paenibacillus ginsengihumi]|uniref:helix-turn-helix domain-containing protein n=1 Tax=Paenibacillus ginsengihumi TaxID=431596 RepID=UPI000362771A|nr:helix-turn-helix transcriptional regulator [Paenibacillus ginsengihumi]